MCVHTRTCMCAYYILYAGVFFMQEYTPKYLLFLLEEQQLVDVCEIHFNTDKVIYSLPGGRKGWCSLQDCILMEYIGVKDANGQDLYVNDVVVDEYGNEFIIKHFVNAGLNLYGLRPLGSEYLDDKYTVCYWCGCDYIRTANLFAKN